MDTYQKSLNSWALYQFASNAFALIIISTLLPIYYSHVAASNLTPTTATIFWGYTNSASLLIAACLSPILGAIANSYAVRKRLLITFAGLGIVTTTFFFFITSGEWLFASILYVFATFFYSMADLFQNALLPLVSRPKDIDRVSSKGFAFGYLGGGILLALNLLFIDHMHQKELAVRLSFLSVSIWWAVFMIPLILNVKEPPVTTAERGNPVITGFRHLAKTFSQIKQYRNLMLFLVAFWLYNEGIGTIIIMAAIYGAEIGINQQTLVSALLVTQFVGVPFAIAFGYLAGWFGAKRSIFLGLFVYILVLIGAFYMSTPLHFWILSMMVGTVQGGTQALSRSLFGRMTPKDKVTEFFGFYNMSSKLGSFIGPLVFSLVSRSFENGRYGILALSLFFVLGAVLLSFVEIKEEE